MKQMKIWFMHSRYFASKGPTTNVRSRGLSLFVEIHL
jgi:hypothetical protein